MPFFLWQVKNRIVPFFVASEKQDRALFCGNKCLLNNMTANVSAVPQLPDDLWLQILSYLTFDFEENVVLLNSENVDHIMGPQLYEDDSDNGEPWFFVGPEDTFECIFGREPFREV